MNVEQLIAELQKLPKHLPVVVDGYEGGVLDLEKVRLVSIQRDVNDSVCGYVGPHEVVSYGVDSSELEPAVYLPR